jgi:type IV secretory pathway TraG/TraD family ATPase VirD4
VSLDLYLLAGSIIYYAIEYFFLHWHTSEVLPLFAIALMMDAGLFVYVIAQFIDKKVSKVTLSLLIIPFAWIVKLLFLHIPAISMLSTIPDILILFILTMFYFWFALTIGGDKIKGKTNITDRKNANEKPVNLGKYPIQIVPGLILPTEDRFVHTQVIGSTGSGKTRFVFLPWIQQDIRNGAGVFIFDIKADMKETIIKFVTDKRANRDTDFFCFTLGDKKSHSYNPLAGDKPGDIFNRLVSALYIEKGNEYYENKQKAFLRAAINILLPRKGMLTFEDLYDATLNPPLYFKQICAKMKNDRDAKLLIQFMADPEKMRQALDGLLNKLTVYVSSPWSRQINTRTPDINVPDILTHNQILLFQVNSGEFSDDYKGLSLLMMGHLEAETSKRYPLMKTGKLKPFFIYLDEFYNIVSKHTPGLINKARQAEVGLIFGHQALGDLEIKDFPGIPNIILSNSRHKIVMQIDEQKAVDYFTKSWGTDTVEEWHGSYSTKDGGMQEVGGSKKQEEEFIVHPNDLKWLKLGEGYVKLELKSTGKIIKKVKFEDVKYDELVCHTLYVPHDRLHKTPVVPEIEVKKPPPASLKDKYNIMNPSEDAAKDKKDIIKTEIPEEDEDEGNNE